MPEKRVELKTNNGQPVSNGEITLTPRSQSLIVRFPVISGGLIWNRPHSVLVQQGEETPVTLPVIDHTRLYQLALLGLGLLGAAILGRYLQNE